MKIAEKHIGLLHWVFPGMLLLAALDILLSGRDLSRAFAALEADVQSIVETTRHPVLAWVQRGVSLLLLGASLERIFTHFKDRKPTPSVVLLIAFVLYWICTVALPAVFGANPKVSHEYAYSLLFGVALALSTPMQRDRVLTFIRNALLIFLLASLALVPVMPSLVMDMSYSQGLLPGVPRFGGLASHPVGMGALAWTTLICLWVHPFERRWLTVLSWVLGLTVLFFAQSKTAWVAFMIAAACMVLVRRLPDSLERVGDPRQNSVGVVLCVGVIGAVVVALLALLVADLPGVIAGFFDTSQGAQLMSMTGRDRIWVVAFDEWQHNPVFGYGLTIWDAAHRQAIGMPFATHAHNQFIDTLARCGTVGATALVMYALVLTVQAFRYARATGGLSLALWAGLALLSISEVPLMLFGYGVDLFMHLLLIVSIAAGAAGRRRETVETVPLRPTFRTAV
jgi:O-antigen ligase